MKTIDWVDSHASVTSSKSTSHTEFIFLLSVKKTLEGEARATGSSKKNTIKDLKFLTPVRRSCRIQRKSSRLPGMLTDHDPCVSSLAELVQLDDDANAYIYRKNPALLEELPDHPRDLGKL